MDDESCDQVASPLNMSTGAAVDQASENLPPEAAAVVAAHWDRLARVPVSERTRAYNKPKWDRELVTDLQPVYRALGYDEAIAARLSMVAAHTANRTVRALLAAGHPVFAAPNGHLEGVPS